MLIGFSGYQGVGENPDGIGEYSLSGCAPGQICCAACASQAAVGAVGPCAPCSQRVGDDRFWHPWRYPPPAEAVGAVEERAGVLLETGLGALLGYALSPPRRENEGELRQRDRTIMWTGAGAALGGLVGKWGIGAILVYGLYERYRLHRKYGSR